MNYNQLLRNLHYPERRALRLAVFFTEGACQGYSFRTYHKLDESYLQKAVHRLRRTRQ